MNDDLEELYQSIILDHNRRPQNFRAMPEATAHADGTNPMCGDQFTVYLHMQGDVVDDVSFQGSGCAISKASASLMTQAVKGKTKAEAERLFESFHGLVTGHAAGEDLGKLKAFSGVSRFPLRVKCATLAWHAMRSALGGPPGADGAKPVRAAEPRA